MRPSFFLLRVFSVIVSAVSFLLPGSSRAETPANLPMRDDFESNFTLDWETIRPDPTHMSLESHPGKLTITTQYGSIHQAQTTARNLLFVNVPEGWDDFVATTCVEDFLPETIWQQAGLMFYNDDDNFIKWVRDYTSRGHPVLNVNWEIAQENKGVNAPVDVSKERFWLRAIKRGNVFQCLASQDGRTWTTYAAIPWGDGSLKKVGLVAKNGPREGDLEAQFDFFELRKPTEAELADPVYRVRRALLGNWKAAERKIGGKAVTQGPDTLLIATPGTLTLKERSNLVVSYTIDLSASPNRITLIPRAHGIGQLLNGVYSLEGDTLTLCLNPNVNGEPPETLESKEGDGFLFLKMQRQEESK
jgi:hypothetical protein